VEPLVQLNRSLWLDGAERTFPRLTGDVDSDVAVTAAASPA
jgi:hypothetical protein